MALEVQLTDPLAMNAVSNPSPHEFRLPISMLIMSSLAPSLSFLPAVWCAFCGLYSVAILSGLASILGLLSTLNLARKYLVIRQNHLEFCTGFSASRRVHRNEVTAVKCQVGSSAMLTLTDGSVVPLSAPGTTPYTLYRALDSWFKHPEHESL